ncbi:MULTISPECIES: GNAT family N-acetyltransferase [Pseudomonas]|uniref:GNAT family N-acetyltransferase n=1 Tax=Pseudomonas haemolytica TaxID=2600065 RepID=A0A5P1D5G4_9PSED|nr:MULTISPECIES: GNAT family N-acetyltransferase [Pseudomonas]MBJ2244497.1 GNAT family N-acetyltransferase [Pseudomonas haemolytica]MBJ2271649.1 GNAT family N-acetyltransferase [Pseudomonas haemolytica]MBJ2284366.1 GNAT family N-acetyltransferase [Pseudomonas sp. MF6755]MBK3447808.1 GNAT family N-acetyltransferase [Pseudomonas haemolytica]MBK3459482.1 GNAT family N-acetyltransferase [Pseudomonas haemolytica]
MADYFQLLRRDLTGSLPAPQWPADTRLDHYRDELAPAIHAVLRMTQDQGGGRVASLDDWRRQFVSDAECDPTLCLVASNADGILAVAQCWTSAFIKNLAVHPCAQGQGLGRALLLHSFQVFKQRGEPYVDLKVLESNLRARQLYESAGMRFVLRDIVPKG